MNSIVRTMARAIARVNMKKDGYTKKSVGKEKWSEFFHKNWRHYTEVKRKGRNE